MDPYPHQQLVLQRDTRAGFAWHCTGHSSGLLVTRTFTRLRGWPRKACPVPSSISFVQGGKAREWVGWGQDCCSVLAWSPYTLQADWGREKRILALHSISLTPMVLSQRSHNPYKTCFFHSSAKIKGWGFFHLCKWQNCILPTSLSTR